MGAGFVFCFSEDDEAAAPTGDLGGNGVDGFHQGMDSWFAQTAKQQAGVCAGRELAGIGEIQILGDEKATFCTHSLPDFRIRSAAQVLLGYGVNVVPVPLQNGHQSRGQVFVELDLHASTGVASSGRSSFADTAAKATTARTASRLSVGKSSKSSSVSIPTKKLRVGKQPAHAVEPTNCQRGAFERTLPRPA